MAPPPLPEELLTLICSHLCFHCQNPDDFPNADDPCVRESKATLARLCRASKLMLAIGQPILYHYFASGNMPAPPYPLLRECLQVDDKLPVFLGTIIRNPFLATHIRSLQLHDTYVLSSLTPELRSVINGASEKLGITTPIFRLQWVTVPLTPDPRNNDIRLENDTRAKIHVWLQEVTIALTPLTEKLLCGQTSCSPLNYTWPSSTLLPALTSVAARNSPRSYGFSMVEAVARVAPNLTSLHLTNGNENFNSVAAFPMPQIRRLVADGIPLSEFGGLIKQCGGLRDLEYYYDTDFYGIQVLAALSPIKGTLKRFCYMFSSTKLASFSDVGAPYEILVTKNQSRTIESLHRMSQLEELVIDQWAIYSSDYYIGDTKRLIKLLPASIQSVHFRYVYRTMQAELLLLALAAPNNFPELRRLKIDIAPSYRPEQREGLEQMRRVEVDFADVGVQVEWGVDKSYPPPKTMTTESTASLVPAPVVSPPIDTSSMMGAEISSITTESLKTRRGWRGVKPKLRERISSFRSIHLPG
ncbi:hypothetical protein V491_07375 [Pseudogymnoascus sp. VKM F-3775]|nr:hypothetical protein V491_07375 [Pseudogymnoascus sp. VKM F-3775]